MTTRVLHVISLCGRCHVICQRRWCHVATTSSLAMSYASMDHGTWQVGFMTKTVMICSCQEKSHVIWLTTNRHGRIRHLWRKMMIRHRVSNMTLRLRRTQIRHKFVIKHILWWILNHLWRKCFVIDVRSSLFASWRPLHISFQRKTSLGTVPPLLFTRYTPCFWSAKCVPRYIVAVEIDDYIHVR